MLIDTHIHLNDSAYANDLDHVIAEARKHHIEKIIVAGIDEETSKQAVELAQKYLEIYAAIGVHPSEVLKQKKDPIIWMKELVRLPKVVAIGEIGLDYYWDKTYNDEQKRMFRSQLEFAKEQNLPVVVHSREAIADTYDLMKQVHVQGVMHCYSSSVEMAKEFIKLGYFIGVGGVVTFPNAMVLKHVVEEIPLEYLLTETDGPYLAPMPYRGKRNEPSYIRFVLAEIAKMKKMDVQEVEHQIEKNVNKLFRI